MRSAPAPSQALLAVIAGISLGVLALACEPPEVDAPVPNDPRTDAGFRFPDSLVGYVKSGVATMCADAYAIGCGQSPVAKAGCVPSAAIGPNDGQVFSLSGTDNITLWFRCGAGINNTFTIYGDPHGGSAIVEVSDDLSTWVAPSGVLTASGQQFNLRQTNLRMARYVRITARNSTIDLDAVQAE